MPHNYRFQYQILIVFEMVLFQYGQTLAGCDMHVPDVGFNLAGQNFQKSRFAGTVRPDQAIAVAGCEFYVYIFK
ncbi:hypothetical protein D3C75_1088130 [compost metagenome]